MRPHGARAVQISEPVTETLPNGLVVRVDERRVADTVAFQLTARAGSRHDGSLAGIAAITSRMMAQGTSRRPSEAELQRVVTQVGGVFGRGTSTETSMFTSVVQSRDAAVAFDLLADVVQDPLFDADALARQKQIALQDLAARRANTGVLIDDVFQGAIFAGHPLGGPILGTPDTIAAITRDDVLANYRRFWGAANLVLTIVGRIRAADALAAARDAFGDLPAGERNRWTAIRPAPLDMPRSVQVEAGQQQLLFRLGFAAPSLADDDHYAFRLLNAITGGAAGRFFREIRTLRGLAYSAGSGYLRFTDGGAWYAAAGIDPENLDMTLDLVRTEITKLREQPPDAGEVSEVAGAFAGSLLLAAETNAARAAELASQEVLGIAPTDEIVRRIRQVTPEDVQRVARAYLDLDRSLLVVVAPPPAT